jgi:hypothetical protein
MTSQIRAFLFFGAVVAAMALGQWVTAAVTVLQKAGCKDHPLCDGCTYRVNQTDNCASRQICNAYKCGPEDLQMTIQACVYDPTGTTCTGNQGVTQGCFAPCTFWNCGCVTGAGQCIGNCDCKVWGGTNADPPSGWLEC